MSTGNPTGPVIDLEAIKREAAEAVGKMSREDLLKEAEKLRVRQKTQQKRQQSKGSQKEYMRKKLERDKLIRAQIEALGLTDEIDAKAEEQAKANHEKWLAEQAENAEESEEVAS